jgi:hypothetical protein
MIFHRDRLTQLNIQQSISFVRANSALEGHRLTFTDIKNSIKVISGKLTADDLIEQIIVRKGLRKAASSIS